jgi:prepilin-type N-terminal cleavage/methylation domain-containing protein
VTHSAVRRLSGLSGAGFTLLELLLSVVIIGMIVGISLPVYDSFTRRNDLDLATQNLADSVRRAQNYARAVRGDSVWGVVVQPSGFTLFKGASFASRDAAFDENDGLPGSITPSGSSEITFAKLTAAPSAASTFTLTSSTNDARTVTVNAEGMVEY